MKRIGVITVVLFLMSTVANPAQAIEEAPYTVMKSDGMFELRDYAPQIVAEIMVDGDLEGAGSKAFRPLFDYISGANKARRKLAMTAPVSQEQQGEKIAMTAPVGQQHAQGQWAVSFMMPAAYTLDTLPTPVDPRITLRQVPARQVAAVRYTGFWSEERYLLHKEKLAQWIAANGLIASGEPVWARYNAPFTLWFLRRNEVLIPVTAAAR